MNYETRDNEIILKIKAANDGKFKFKTRNNPLGFGESFSTRVNNFDDKVYLEWQIGYDAVVSDVEAGEKETKLSAVSFIGANGKEKYPYELSELLYDAMKLSLISKDKIIQLLGEINSYSDFIDKTDIRIQPATRVQINGMNFEETSINLPALFMVETVDGTQVEIHTKQQQYASGTQPMVYFCIPINTFSNSGSLLGRPSVVNDELIYIINDRNVGVLFDLVKIFSMCSERHNFDIKKILGVLLELN